MSREATSSRLLFAGVALAALFALGAWLPRHPDLDLLFGVDTYARFGGPVLVAAAAVLLTLLAAPGLAGTVASGLA
ncbi:MAG: hypothetical protein ACYS99_13775, partial [Planctomycetota bacterium]